MVVDASLLPLASKYRHGVGFLGYRVQRAAADVEPCSFGEGDCTYGGIPLEKRKHQLADVDLHRPCPRCCGGWIGSGPGLQD